MAGYLGNVGCFNQINVVQSPATDPKSEILTWLSPLQPSIRHRDVRNRRTGNVGEWVLQTVEFQRWRDDALQEGSSDPTLFCYGDPGVGKTYIR